jgi:hypothetical protein
VFPSVDEESDEIQVTPSMILILSKSITALIDLPAFAHVDEPVAVSYTILNNSASKISDLVVNVEASEMFIFSGMKQVSIKLLPMQSRLLTYQLWPLSSGITVLPQFRVYDSSKLTLNSQEDIREFESTAKPITLFVKPRRFK